MTTKHTPGPWKYSAYLEKRRTSVGGAYCSECGGYTRSDRHFARIDMNGHFQAITAHDSDPEELRANARLIAAAPELLETLRAVESDIAAMIDGMGSGVVKVSPGGIRACLSAIRDAIQKATGEG